MEEPGALRRQGARRLGGGVWGGTTEAGTGWLAATDGGILQPNTVLGGTSVPFSCVKLATKAGGGASRRRERGEARGQCG